MALWTILAIVWFLIGFLSYIYAITSTKDVDTTTLIIALSFGLGGLFTVLIVLLCYWNSQGKIWFRKRQT